MHKQDLLLAVQSHGASQSVSCHFKTNMFGSTKIFHISKFKGHYHVQSQPRLPKTKLLHFEWSPPWHHIETYLSQILTFFVLKSGEDEKERIILMKSRALRSLDFIRIILSSSSLLLVRGPVVTTVIYQAKLIQTDPRYAWFKIISDARASRDA